MNHTESTSSPSALPQRHTGQKIHLLQKKWSEEVMMKSQSNKKNLKAQTSLAVSRAETHCGQRSWGCRGPGLSLPSSAQWRKSSPGSLNYLYEHKTHTATLDCSTNYFSVQSWHTLETLNVSTFHNYHFPLSFVSQSLKKETTCRWHGEPRWLMSYHWDRSTRTPRCHGKGGWLSRSRPHAPGSPFQTVSGRQQRLMERRESGSLFVCLTVWPFILTL